MTLLLSPQHYNRVLFIKITIKCFLFLILSFNTISVEKKPLQFSMHLWYIFFLLFFSFFPLQFLFFLILFFFLSVERNHFTRNHYNSAPIISGLQPGRFFTRPNHQRIERPTDRKPGPSIRPNLTFPTFSNLSVGFKW